MMKQRELLIDTDPGVDDALAIIMCRMHAGVSVKALTVCGGNVGLPFTLRNAAVLASQFNGNASDGPPKLYAGAERALLAQAPDAAFVHGTDGFGDANLAPPHVVIEPLHAALGIIEQAKRAKGNLEILALAPLTNIALALALEPGLPKLVKRLTVMGGAITGVGNITAHAEFNIAVDPDAAQMVFSRWPELTVLDWEASMRYAPTIAATEQWFAQETNNSRFMHQISRKTRVFKDSLGGAHWHWADPLAAYVALFPERVQYQRAGVAVIRQGFAAGTTLLNTREARHLIANDLDINDFHQVMISSLSR